MQSYRYLNVLMLLFVLTHVAHAKNDDDSSRSRARKMYLEVKSDFKDVPEVKLSRLQELMDKGEVQFVDVREDKERAVSMIPGAITKSALESNRSKYKDKVIVVYCTIGYRSAKYIRKLRKKNILAYNLEGSILGWVHSNRPVVNSKGKEVKKVHVYGSSWNVLPKGYVGTW